MEATDNSQRNKIVLLGVMLVGVLGYFGYEYAYRPRAEQIAQLEDRLEMLELRNRTARALVERDGQEEVERRLMAYREQLAHVEGLVPSSEELPDLLDLISAEAQRTGVEVSLIQPVAAIAEDYYTRRTYALGVLGTYHQLGHFLTRVASLPRIVTSSAFSVTVRNEETRSGDPQLEAKFTIETYVLPLNHVVADASETR